jgi:hypothetical protein
LIDLKKSRLNKILILSFGGYENMNVKETLEKQLAQIERDMSMLAVGENKAKYEQVKVNILLALQKYEN